MNFPPFFKNFENSTPLIKTGLPIMTNQYYKRLRVKKNKKKTKQKTQTKNIKQLQQNKLKNKKTKPSCDSDQGISDTVESTDEEKESEAEREEENTTEVFYCLKASKSCVTEENGKEIFKITSRGISNSRKYAETYRGKKSTRCCNMYWLCKVTFFCKMLTAQYVR